MNCRTGERLLSQQQDGALPQNRAEELALHLEACPSCRRYQKTLQALHTDLHALNQNEPVTSRLAQRAVAQWTETQQSTVPSLRSPWFRPAMALTLSVTVLAIGFGAMRLRQDPIPARRVSIGHGIVPLRIHQGEETVANRPATEEAADTTQRLTGVTPLIGPKGTAKRQAGLYPAAPRPAGIPGERPVSDLDYLNTDPVVTLARWTHNTPGEIEGMMERLHASVCGGDDFVNVPMPQLAGQDEKTKKIAADQYKQEAETVDTRLTKKVTLGEKGVSFADLCRLLKEQSGIEITANASIADDKVTLFCKERSLRDLMRQVNRLFGYLWNRTGKAGDFRYELTQSVRAQLAEEELRNRDRDEALLALDREMERYRKFLNLSPEEAKAQAETASPEDKKVLESLAGSGWGPAHLYFGLSPQDMDALRNGQELSFAEQAEGGQDRSLPMGLSSGILGSLNKLRAKVGPGGELSVGPAENVPDGQMLSDVPGASSRASLHLDTSELGQMSLSGNSGASIKSMEQTPDGKTGQSAATVMMGSALAVGVSPSVGDPKNAAANAKLAKDPALRPHATVTPQAAAVAYNPRATLVTTADVEEALFKATGKDILADYYTRLYEPSQFTLRDKPLFEILNKVSDTMHDRWNWENGFLQFRSTGFFNDRMKEVPNRLLTRWAEAHRQRGALTLEELIEIAQLTDRQLNAQTMAQGAQLLYGLKQWDQAQNMRADWRFLARLSPAQRTAAQSPKGLPYSKLPITLQERFLAMLYGPEAEQLRLEAGDLTDTLLRVEYAMPTIPGTDAPEPKITYQMSGGATVDKRTRTITPSQEEIVSPGNSQVRQNKRSR